MKTFLTSLHIRRWLFRSDLGFTCVLATLLLSLEIVGRQLSNDYSDVFGMLLLWFIVTGVGIRHQEARLPWVVWLTRRWQSLRRWFTQHRIELGIDLRGRPRFRSKLPSFIRYIIIGLGLWSTLLLVVWEVHPTGWRTLLAPVSYTLYLVLLTVLWALLGVSILLCWLLPVWLIQTGFLRHDWRWSRRQFLYTLGALSYSFGIVLATWLIPSIGAVLPFLASLLACLWVAIHGGKSEICVIWRRNSDSPIYSIPMQRFLMMGLGLILLALAAIISTAAGNLIVDNESLSQGRNSTSTMPWTNFLGTLLLWCSPGACLAAWLLWHHMNRTNPERPVPIAARLLGCPEPMRSAVGKLFRSWGWMVRDHIHDSSIVVDLQWVEPELSQLHAFDAPDPLPISEADLHNPMLRERVERRFELACRKVILQSTQQLLQVARASEHVGGNGYWFAPHWWFLMGLRREEIDSGEGEHDPNPAEFHPPIIGSPYSVLYPPECRHLFFRMMRSLQIDLIFIEDGISPKKFNKVLQRLFDLVDRYAGQRPAEDIHFVGIPKVRVMIHDFLLGEPFESSTYPEPQFEDLARARILHVFRDRGEDDELIECPVDITSTPTPLGRY